MSAEERREGTAGYGGWREAHTLEDVEEQEQLVDRYAERNPGMVDQSDAEIARGMLKLVRGSIERYGMCRVSWIICTVLAERPEPSFSW